MRVASRSALMGGKTMLNVRTPWNAKARKGAAAAAVVLLMSLVACGGGNNSITASGANAGGVTTGEASDNEASTPSNPSTNASFFNRIFLRESGAGYYQFDANFQGGRAIGSGRTEFYVNS